MGENHRCRVSVQGQLYDFTRVHAGPVDGAAEQLIEADHPVPVVQQQAAEEFVWQVPQARAQVVAGGPRIFQGAAPAQRLHQLAAPDFDDGLKLGMACDPQPAAPGVGMPGGDQQWPQAPEMTKQPLRDSQRRPAADAGAQEYGEQLCVRQRRDAMFQELVLGPLSLRPVSDSHIYFLVRGWTAGQSCHLRPNPVLHGPFAHAKLVLPQSRRFAGLLPLPWKNEMSILQAKRVLLGVTGGIAVYKCPDLVRRLRDKEARVQVVMTAGAEQFVTAMTFQAVSGRPVRAGLWDSQAEAAMGHIELARWADVIVIAPASADFLARQTAGMANDLLSTVCLASDAPVVVAPAMNQQMWAHPATRANCKTLAERGVHFLGPGEGDQACDEVGPGRMLEPDEIVSGLEAILGKW